MRESECLLGLTHCTRSLCAYHSVSKPNAHSIVAAVSWRARSAYGDPTCLSPELLLSWTQHLQDKMSCEVLLDVFTNSTGPLPQELLPLNIVVSINTALECGILAHSSFFCTLQVLP